jgi:hypothetical protein
MGSWKPLSLQQHVHINRSSLKSNIRQLLWAKKRRSEWKRSAILYLPSLLRRAAGPSLAQDYAVLLDGFPALCVGDWLGICEREHLAWNLYGIMDTLGVERRVSSGGACKASFLIGAHRSFSDAEAIFYSSAFRQSTLSNDKAASFDEARASCASSALLRRIHFFTCARSVGASIHV